MTNTEKRFIVGLYNGFIMSFFAHTHERQNKPNYVLRRMRLVDKKEKKAKARKKWLNPFLSWGVVASVALLVLFIGIYSFCF